jgi:hypothetical protein
VRVAPVPESKLEQSKTPAPSHNGTAYWIKISAKPDGSFTVTNGRNGFSKVYPARAVRRTL